ncbi:MAG TPA: type III polyketide synthase [Croceicoccus sp.]|nr:type III polyketide synthase [Croceicoccus sp.]
MTQPHINAIATAVPPHEAHAVFREWAEAQIADPRQRKLFGRMADRSGISHRWTVLAPPADGSQTGFNGFYGRGMPPTSARMAVYAKEAPDLVMQAAEGLGPLHEVTHLVLASCTGFVAPGIDQIVARRLGLAPSVERTLVGFMGCYAAVAALRTARHIVRSEPAARVLVVTVELCTLHLQADDAVDEILTMLLFGDGAAAAIVSADPVGIALGDPFSATLPDSEDLIGWTIGDTGFDMTLSGAVPGHIREAIASGVMRRAFGDPATVDGWAVHAGGRTVLDAVEQGFDLAPDALAESRAVLRDFGNMSSATLMFVLARVLADDRRVDNGVALAFGPGLAIEGFRYRMHGRSGP